MEHNRVAILMPSETWKCKQVFYMISKKNMSMIFFHSTIARIYIPKRNDMNTM